MLDDLTTYAEVNHCLQTANQVLNVDLLNMINQGPAEQLNQTQWTQPALLAVSVGIFKAVQASKEMDVTLMAGHSLGEYSALVCAGALDFEVALDLVYKRGLYMQAAVPAGTGSMAAVLGLDSESIEQACLQAHQSTGKTVSPAKYNSPGQIVIAGESEAVAKASQLCVEAGAKKVMPLAVSVPSHCELMRPAAEKLAVDLAEIDIKQGHTPVIHNVDVQTHHQVNTIKSLLEQQLYSPVRWTQTMEKLQQAGIETVAECGPGKVLSGLFKRFDRSLQVISLLNDKGIESFLATQRIS